MDSPIHREMTWAQSHQGHPLELVCLRAPKSPQAPWLLIGGMHGDEPEGRILAQQLLSTIEALSAQQQSQLRPFYLIPDLNPDGHALATRTNGQGVDLNRNFPSRDWSPLYQEARYNPGPRPQSEPEVQALVRLIEKAQPSLIIHFHSWKPAVVLTGPPELEQAHTLSQKSGYPLQLDIGYPTPGSLGQWAWRDCGIPVICTEERENCPEEEVWPRFGPGLLQLLQS